MIPQIEKLTEEESKLIYSGPILVTILIAGADDNIDKNEKEKALLMANFNYQTFVFEPKIEAFYKEVSKNFMSKMTNLLNSLPPKAKERNPAISELLGQINTIWPKLDQEFALLYYESLKFLADTVAKASGGVLGVGKIGKEEKKWLALEMLEEPF